ncbi:hypothetical protein GGQ68_004533 [Sagittula marina]|uniref:histidine kinase n=2 Tax=Sagittula marina TaxID=943940 RepID=A0A7W6DSH4_9RHOB|nr:hypothetical protein [Sagittula marina]
MTFDKPAQCEASRHYLEQELNDLLQNDLEAWRFIQRGSLDGVWYWNIENPNDEWMSPEFWQTLGIDPKTRQHSPAEWQDIINKDDLAVALDNFKKHCADSSHPYDQIVRYRHADGSTVWVRCRGIAVRDKKGRAIRMLGAHNDVTSLKRAEQRALEAESRKLRLATDEMQALAYSLAHDLKAPVQTSRRLVEEVLRDGDTLDEEQIDLLGHAFATMGRMQTLVDDVLNFATLAKGDAQISMVNVREVAEEVRGDFRAMIDDTGAEVVIDPLPVILAARTQIRLLLQNLIANAIKYRRPGVPPVVRVSTGEATSHSVCITVTDNGIGVPKAYRQRIFDMFSRLHRHDDIPGSGLGLALCARIAVMHGGSIAVQSGQGEGSCFAVTLPIEDHRRDSA